MKPEHEKETGENFGKLLDAAGEKGRGVVFLTEDGPKPFKAEGDA